MDTLKNVKGDLDWSRLYGSQEDARNVGITEANVRRELEQRAQQAADDLRRTQRQLQQVHAELEHKDEALQQQAAAQAQLREQLARLADRSAD